MSGVGLEVFLEDLIPEIAYSGEKGVSIIELLKIVRQYHLSLEGQNGPSHDAAQSLQGAPDDRDLEKSLTDAEFASARWAWDWLRSRPQILINGNKRWNRMELKDALALPEADTIDPALTAASSASAAPEAETKAKEPTADQAKGKKRTKKTLTTRPRIHPAEDLVWQTLTRHGVDYKRVPALEWACLQGIASTRGEGILQSDLRRLVDQDKRSLPKRTDSLARKGYIAKRTVVVQKMKTSRLWLIDFAPPLVETEKCGLDLTPETLSKDLEPVSWHERWTGNNIDMDALGRTAVGVVKAFNVIRYADLRLKMGVSGKRWQMKTLAKNCQRLVDVGVLKYTAASFPGTRKVFKDCLKFVREPSAEEWEKFLATGKKTSQYSDPTRHREPKPNALALYKKSGEDGAGGDARAKVRRIFSGWIPEKPLAQTVFEVIRSSGAEGASNPQVSVATVGYQHRRYLSSYLTKVADTQQPAHLKKFQVVSELVRTGKTSAYMFSALSAISENGSARTAEGVPAEEETTKPQQQQTAPNTAPANPYGFGAVRTKALQADGNISLSEMAQAARKTKASAKRKLLPRIRPEHVAAARVASDAAATPASKTETPAQESQPAETTGDESASRKRSFDDMAAGAEKAEGAVTEPAEAQETQSPPTIVTLESRGPQVPKIPTDQELIMTVRYNNVVGKLQVHRADRKVTFLRSGRGLKKPVTVQIDENLSEPVIQDDPEDGGRKILVLETGAQPPQTYAFGVEDEGNPEKAGWIQQEITKMRSADYQPPTPEEITAASQTTTTGITPAEPAAKGKGRGRGKGKKGQALAAGAKPYVCDLCGGAWKNDIGLKYHLQKAQVPCNPNFDPTILLERSRKRRRLSPVPPPSDTVSIAGDEKRGRRTGRRGASGKRKAGKDGKKRKKGGGKKDGKTTTKKKTTRRLRVKIRKAMRTSQDPIHQFRGLEAAAAEAVAINEVNEVDTPAMWESERPKGAEALKVFTRGSDAAAAAGKNTLTESTISPFGFGPRTGGGRTSSSRVDYGGAVTQKMAVAGFARAGRATRGATRAVSGGQGREPPFPSLPTAPTTPSRSRSRASEEGAVPLVSGARSGKRSRAAATAEGYSMRDTTGAAYPGGFGDGSPTRGYGQEFPVSEYPDLGIDQQREQQQVFGQQQQEEDGAPDSQDHYKPFARSSNYDRMTSDAKRRTAQAFDIINYLLDNTNGVFPGDKALFYALTKVFLTEFRRQMPPTWKNCTSAVKALETRKLAAVHTHMLKTERGRLQTCTLIVRAGVDPNGPAAAAMKQLMRETYPGTYVPPAFSPTQEELLRLQEYDTKTNERDLIGKPNANGRKFRSRRKIEEIEVFNATYYKNTAPVVGPRRDPLWIRETERLVEEDEEGEGEGDEYHDRDQVVGRGRRKRRAREDIGGGSSTHKRARTGYQEDEYYYNEDDIPVDPNIMGEMDPSQYTQHQQQQSAQQQEQEDQQQQQWQQEEEEGEGPSVLEAIKAYSLLPAKLGPRAGRRRMSHPDKPLAKLPAEVGRVRNPGLGSLPGEFLYGGALVQFGVPGVCFLEVNTCLEDGDGDEEEVDVDDREDRGRSVSPESLEDNWEDVKAEEAPVSPEAAKGPKAVGFTWPVVLEQPPSGVWPTYAQSFFENYHDNSFALHGWMPRLAWLQAQNIPTSVQDMVGRMKPAQQQNWVDEDYARVCGVLNQCAAWEQSPAGTAIMLGQASAASSSNGYYGWYNYNFINVSTPPSSIPPSRPITLTWSDDTQYNLETLPYEDLEDDDYTDVLFIDDDDDAERAGINHHTKNGDTEGPSPPKKRRIPKTAPPPGTERRKPGRPPKLKLAPIKTMRELTAYPRSAQDFLRKVNNSNNNTGDAGGEGGEDEDGLDWSRENVRLAAFIVVTTLLGGVDRVVDWGLMLRLVPDQTISQLRHYWCALKKDRLSTIVSLTEKFRRAFLRAYERDEIPPLDFNNVLAYDWKFLIKWTTKLDLAERRVLPASRAALDKKVTVTKFTHGNRPWREAFYHPQRSIFNKFQDVTSEPLSFRADGDAGETIEMSSNTHNNGPVDLTPQNPELIVAMSWTRSLCVTPVEAYTADAVLHRRNSLFPTRAKTEITELMMKGVDQLQRQGVISKSSSKWSNGRRWRFNTRVLDSIEKSAQQHKFAQAAQFKQELDQAFRAEDPAMRKKRVTYITNDGMIMALLNMQAHGRVRVETTGQPHVPMGHEPGNYETRKYTKKYMHFRLDVTPTERYLFDDYPTEEVDQESSSSPPNKDQFNKSALTHLRAHLRTHPPPTVGPHGAVPVWCDVFGAVHPARWIKYLSAVLITLASRGSMRAAELVATLKPVIMEFEAELILEWVGGLGLVAAQGRGMAPAVGEWWWVVVEMQREGFEVQGNGKDGFSRGGGAGEGHGIGNGDGSGIGARQRKALPSGRPARGGRGGRGRGRRARLLGV